MIIIMLILVITLRGAIQDFLQSPYSTANCFQLVCSSEIVCKSRATHRALSTCKCHVTCHVVRRDSLTINFDRVQIIFILSFNLLAEPLNDEGCHRC